MLYSALKFRNDSKIEYILELLKIKGFQKHKIDDIAQTTCSYTS